MLNSAVITKVQTTLTPDGQGGYTEETIELGSFDVQLSIGNNVEEATAYGVSVEEVLKVVSDLPLMDNESELYILMGPSGAIGPQGAQGIQGIQGAKGDDGVSPTVTTQDAGEYYSVTITDANHTETINIQKGAKGEKGDTGEQGPKGDKGDKGDKGADGTMTFEDLTPEQKASLKGDKGDKGDPGTNGTDGITPVITATATTDATHSATPTVTVTKSGTDAAPAFTFSFVGLQGATGAQGIQGEPGTNGSDYVITTADYDNIAAIVYSNYMTNAANVGY